MLLKYLAVWQEFCEHFCMGATFLVSEGESTLFRAKKYRKTVV
jgi:hypothetical protein